jgi:ABC-type antimicrobial peptide transport system permease subunit
MKLSRYRAKDLLIEDFTISDTSIVTKTSSAGRILRWGLPAVVVIIIVVTMQVKPVNMTDIFFITGILMLIACFSYSSAILKYWNTARPLMTPLDLTIKFASRRLKRSLAVIGIVSAGTFIVFAVSSMSVTLSGLETGARYSGTGGFAFIVRTSSPVPDNLNTAEARKKYFPQMEDSVSFVHVKVKEGDDASCFSLNRPQVPVLLGIVPADMKRRGAFVPAGLSHSVWDLLEEELPDGSIPGITGDSDTATWNLKKRVDKKYGDILTFTDENGEVFKVKLVGKIPVRMSILQGTVIISAERFVRRFPSESGWKMLLVDVADKQKKKKAKQIIFTSLNRFGVEVADTEHELAELISGQQIYLRMFSIPGGLGLLVATMGLGVVLFRNVYERRYELALLRAIGFASKILYRSIVLEHILLLFTGLVSAYLSATVALLPILLSSGKLSPVEQTLVLFILVLVTGILSTLIAVKIITKRQIVHSLVNE